MAAVFAADALTLGLIAGGRGSRLGGIDKGWIERDGIPQVLRFARRFPGETGPVLVSANRGLERYAEAGLQAVTDRMVEDSGPLAGIDALARFANQLPKHRIDDLYPLFFLIGASSGVARGVLDHVVADSAIRMREESAVPSRRQDHTQSPHRVGAGMSLALSANSMV